MVTIAGRRISFRRMLRVILRVSLIVVGFCLIVTALHVWAHVCPFCLTRIHRCQLIPVMIGYPSPEMVDGAGRGEIILGGCTPTLIGGHCPYCRWPARFADWIDPSPEKAVDLRLLPGLSEWEADEAARRARDVAVPSARGEWERVTSAVVTPTDVWFGTMQHGVHRLDRASREWHSHFASGRGSAVMSIRLKGNKVIVDHDTLGGSALFYEDYTTDRGKTWHRLRSASESPSEKPGAGVVKRVGGSDGRSSTPSEVRAAWILLLALHVVLIAVYLACWRSLCRQRVGRGIAEEVCDWASSGYPGCEDRAATDTDEDSAEAEVDAFGDAVNTEPVWPRMVMQYIGEHLAVTVPFLLLVFFTTCPWKQH